MPNVKLGSPAWTRTTNLILNRNLLCQLSYRGINKNLKSKVKNSNISSLFYHKDVRDRLSQLKFWRYMSTRCKTRLTLRTMNLWQKEHLHTSVLSNWLDLFSCVRLLGQLDLSSPFLQSRIGTHIWINLFLVLLIGSSDRSGPYSIQWWVSQLT